MLHFVNDYSEGACEEILRRLMETNLQPESGYGYDTFTASAKEKIRRACGTPEAGVYFLVGGTQTNKVVIDSLLAPYEGVLCAASGHIALHEAGAIEHSGHKVLPLAHKNGKISAEQVKDYVDAFFADPTYPHMVHPGMVYISHPTEYGTLYTREELAALSEVCRACKLPLYLDGARLGYALASPESDLSLRDIAVLTDAFYIGGTKVGALMGEAVVFPKAEPKGFFTRVKQNGALLAKGRLTGLQFDTLFTDDLYYRLGENGVKTARRLREIFLDKGYKFYIDSPTNQTFVILENAKMQALSEKVRFDYWEKYDETHTVVRFCTSFATRMESVEALAALI
ncbi:MAG: low specificity L-threonine aldolase [Clostridia bacterium]|nr:low specificity L-threonine aldolase [Clostridia bacterium]